MQPFNGFTGGIFTVFEWLYRLAVINFLWLIFNLPIIILSVLLIFAQSMNDYLLITSFIILLIPFLAFPSTTVLFALNRKWILKQEFQIIRSFWRYYKESYVKGLLGGIIIGPVWVISSALYYLLSIQGSGGMMSYTLLIFSLFLLVFTAHYLSNTVHFDHDVFTSLKNAFLIMIGSPIMTLTLAVLNGLILFISFNYFTFMLVFFTGSLISLISFLGFYQILIKVHSKKKDATSSKRDNPAS